MNASKKFCGILFLGFLLLFTFSVKAQTLEKLIEEGDQFTEEYNNQKALDTYLKADKQYPNNWEVNWRISRAYVDVGEHMPEYTTKRRSAWETDRTTEQHMPCGRLGLRVYSPYGRVPWERQWTEPAVGALARKLSTIVNELEAEAPSIAKRYEEARRQAEIEHQRWLAECRERERREREQRRAAAVKASREQLLALIDGWALDRRVESFFEEAVCAALRLPPSEASTVNARLE